MSFPQTQPTPPNRGLLTFVLTSVAGALVAMVLLSRCSGTVTYSTAAEHKAEVTRDNAEIAKRCAGVTKENWYRADFEPNTANQQCKTLMRSQSLHLAQHLRPCSFGGVPSVCWSPHTEGQDLYILTSQGPGIYLINQDDIARVSPHVTYP